MIVIVIVIAVAVAVVVYRIQIPNSSRVGVEHKDTRRIPPGRQWGSWRRRSRHRIVCEIKKRGRSGGWEDHCAGQNRPVDLEDVPVGLFKDVWRNLWQRESRSLVPSSLLELVHDFYPVKIRLPGLGSHDAHGLRALVVEHRAVDLVALQVVKGFDPSRQHVQFQNVRELQYAQILESDSFQCGVRGGK